MSIQQSLDGHSFSVAGLDDAAAAGPVEVEVLSAATMLVPAELFDSGAAQGLLAANGMALRRNERAVWSEPRPLEPARAGAEAKRSADAEAMERADKEVVAVMAADAGAVARVEAALGDRVRYTTPLLEPPAAEAVIRMRWRAGLLFCQVCDRDLLFAEVVPAPGEADVSYFTERLARAFPLDAYDLHLAGSESKRLAKWIGKRFRRVVCAS